MGCRHDRVLVGLDGVFGLEIYWRGGRIFGSMHSWRMDLI